MMLCNIGGSRPPPPPPLADVFAKKFFYVFPNSPTPFFVEKNTRYFLKRAPLFHQ